MWLVDGIYGYGYNVYIGVASGCCCKEVYRYPHNNNESTEVQTLGVIRI